MGNKQVYSDPTAAEAIDKVEKGRKKQKMKTSVSRFAYGGKMTWLKGGDK